MLGKELLNLKGSKLGQILRADKTGFRRLSLREYIIHGVQLKDISQEYIIIYILCTLGITYYFQRIPVDIVAISLLRQTGRPD